MKLSTRELATFRRRLLAWFRRHKRNLPWRRTRDPYRIWLSEVMLQQTRVAAVLPYYRRFLRRFPNVRALARARADEVLKHWAGLGYYSRARNLHRAAREIVVRHGGSFPRQLRAALSLPGVGRYTARAVLSIAYGAPYAVLDGNVARVLARLDAIRGDLRDPQRWRQVGEMAQQLVAPAAPGNWNQAVMELGATLCTPRAPRCAACPISRWCRAYRLGTPEAFPGRRRKRAPVKVKIAAAVLLDSRGRTLLIKADSGQDGGLFSRLWQFPAVEVTGDAESELARHLRASLGLRTRGRGMGFVALPQARHSVTFYDIALLPFLVRVKGLPAVDGACTPLLNQLRNRPTSNATRKIARAALGFVQRTPSAGRVK